MNPERRNYRAGYRVGLAVGAACGLVVVVVLGIDLAGSTIGDGWPEYAVTVSAPNQSPISRAWSWTGMDSAHAPPYRPKFFEEDFDRATVLDPITVEIRSKCGDRQSGLGITQNKRWYARAAVIIVEFKTGELWLWKNVVLPDPQSSTSVTCRLEDATRIR